MDDKSIREVYEHLQDEESKRIFGKRLMFSYTWDFSYIHEIWEMLPEVQWLKSEIQRRNDNFLFGAGAYGQAIFSFAPHHWQGILDNDKDKWGKKIGGVTIVPSKTILDHPEARVFVAAHKYGKRYQYEIVDQLNSLGISSERIVRVDRDVVERLEQKQYFDLPALGHDDRECFVDVGAFDGDTAKNFAKWAGKFEHYYAFEPDPECRRKCQEVLQSMPEDRTTLFPYGAWNKSDELHFWNRGDGTSRVLERGEIVVPVRSIDDLLEGKRVTFIKMDIEGSESKAIEGANNIIREQHPKLAICVYHKEHDVVDIPMQILKLYPDYRFYLRHYALRWPETVLYAV